MANDGMIGYVIINFDGKSFSIFYKTSPIFVTPLYFKVKNLNYCGIFALND